MLAVRNDGCNICVQCRYVGHEHPSGRPRGLWETLDYGHRALLAMLCQLLGTHWRLNVENCFKWSLRMSVLAASTQSPQWVLSWHQVYPSMRSTCALFLSLSLSHGLHDAIPIARLPEWTVIVIVEICSGRFVYNRSYSELLKLYIYTNTNNDTWMYAWLRYTHSSLSVVRLAAVCGPNVHTQRTYFSGYAGVRKHLNIALVGSLRRTSSWFGRSSIDGRLSKTECLSFVCATFLHFRVSSGTYLSERKRMHRADIKIIALV